MIPAKMWPQNVSHAYHLRAPSASGGKDWVCIISTHPFHNKHLWVIFGKTVDVTTGAGQGRALTKTAATEAALQAAVRNKLDEGYTLIDEYEARCGWHSQPSSQPAVPPQPQAAAPQDPPKRAKPTTRPAAKAPPKVLEEEKDCGEPTMCW